MLLRRAVECGWGIRCWCCGHGLADCLPINDLMLLHALLNLYPSIVSQLVYCFLTEQSNSANCKCKLLHSLSIEDGTRLNGDFIIWLSRCLLYPLLVYPYLKKRIDMWWQVKCVCVCVFVYGMGRRIRQRVGGWIEEGIYGGDIWAELWAKVHKMWETYWMMGG